MNNLEITIDNIKKLLPIRIQESNKGTYGKVLNIAGCFDYQGAAFLSSLAPLKIGAGLVTLATTKTVINNIAANCPWVTFHKLKDYKKQSIAKNAAKDLLPIIKNYNVVSIGSGLSNTKETKKFVIDVIEYLNKTQIKTVIDADAINILTDTNIELPQNSIITPHPLELSRLINVPVEKIQNNRTKYAKYTAEKYNCTVILKGKNTIICTKELKIFTNTSGNSSLAKAGSGDVLTGIISGLLAQNLSPIDASILGVFVHGLCGELASKDLTEYSVLATDQINYIPNAIKTILES